MRPTAHPAQPARASPSPRRIIVLVAARFPFLRPEVAPEVPGHPLDDVPELDPRELLRRNPLHPVDEPQQIPSDGARAVRVPAVVDGQERAQNTVWGRDSDGKLLLREAWRVGSVSAARGSDAVTAVDSE